MSGIAEPHTQRRRRFGITEVLLVAAILGFGGLALMSEGRLSPASFIEGVDQVLGR